MPPPPGIQRVTYTAAYDPNDSELVIIRDVWGGISGPYGEHGGITSKEEADTKLFNLGYIRTEDWDLVSNGYYSARVSLMKAGE